MIDKEKNLIGRIDLDNNLDLVRMLQTELGIRYRLGEIFQETYVDTWLHTPNNAFDNKKPIELIWENNSEPLYRMITELQKDRPT